MIHWEWEMVRTAVVGCWLLVVGWGEGPGLKPFLPRGMIRGAEAPRSLRSTGANARCGGPSTAAASAPPSAGMTEFCVDSHKPPVGMTISPDESAAERWVRSGSAAAKLVKSWVPRTWRAAWLRAERSSGQGQGQTVGARVGGQMRSGSGSRFEVRGSRDEVRGSRGGAQRGKMRYS